MKDVARRIRYAVRKADVTLAVTIGSGQIGSTRVFLGDKEIGSGGSILKLRLGPGPAIKPLGARVVSLVQDVQSNTNRVSVEYVLTGGVKKVTVVATATVANDLDLCRFETTITFVDPT
jgi:hypothetical protein